MSSVCMCIHLHTCRWIHLTFALKSKSAVNLSLYENDRPHSEETEMREVDINDERGLCQNCRKLRSSRLNWL